MEALLHPNEKAALKQALDEINLHATIVEWGSGGSTFFWLDNMHPDQRLISIEHNKEWYDKVSAELATHPRNNAVDYYYCSPMLSLDFYGYGIPNEENPTYLTNYIRPAKAILKAQLFFIDGIARGPIAMQVLSYMRADAQVFIHDYVGRELWYDWAVKSYPAHKVVGTTLVRMTSA